MTTSFDIDSWQTGQGSNPPSNNTLKGTPFVEYWNELPSLQHDSSNKTTLSVQGHSFKGRMAVLKYLMYDMDNDSVNLWGSNREWHWLWGYASQLDWQHRSGRLNVDGLDSNDTDTISTRSWWNYMNFCFSVCILLGAQQSGNGIEHIELDKASQELVSNDFCIQQCIASWKHLFETAYQEYKDTMKSMTASSKEFGSVRFKLQQKVWIAHTSVIHYTIAGPKVSPRAAELLQKLPQPEQDFGLGWCRMVEIIAACTFPTDLVSLLQDGAGFLPLQIVTCEYLDEWEQSTTLHGPEARRYNSVVVTHELLTSSAESLHRMASFWQRIVRTNDVSRAMPRTIRELATGTTRIKLQQLTRLFYLYVRPREVMEWSIAVTLLSILTAATARARSKK